jgi:hypothetical protein
MEWWSDGAMDVRSKRFNRSNGFTPAYFLPRDAGEDVRRGLERLEQLELLEPSAQL